MAQKDVIKIAPGCTGKVTEASLLTLLRLLDHGVD